MPPLLLLHGFLGGAEGWDPALLTPLGAERPLLALDLPGHGPVHTTEEPVPGNFPVGLPSLLAQIDRALPASPFDLLGYSMGARLALHVALARPQQVRRLILESGSPGIENPKEREARIRLDEERAQMLEREGLLPFLDHWDAQPLFSSRARLSTRAAERLRATRLENSPHSLAQALRALSPGRLPPLWTALPSLTHPTLLLAGELDARFVRTQRAMQALLPNAELRVVAGVGHTVHLEAPEEWIGAVLDFLSR